jgi:anti-sigma factor RsiW
MAMVITETNNDDRGHEHFTEDDWVEFARRRGDPEHRARVARHLEAGCRECQKTLRLWAAMLSVADQETSDPSVAAAVGATERRPTFDRAETLGERVSRAVALVFDSFRNPQLAGVRAAGLSPRHLLYKAGRYTIKLQVEPGTVADRLSIMGQVLNEQDPTGVLRDIAVRALKGSKTLDRTLTNELGEFHLEPDASERLQLSIDVPEIGTFSVHPSGAAAAASRGAGPKGNESRGHGTKARPR